MKIESRPIAELSLDESNVLEYGPDDIGKIAKSLARFGQQKPIGLEPQNTGMPR